jgi:hypothetical protein
MSMQGQSDRPLGEPGPHRVVSHVEDCAHEMLIALDDVRGESVLKEVTDPAVASVEPLCVEPVEAVHAFRKASLAHVLLEPAGPR